MRKFFRFLNVIVLTLAFVCAVFTSAAPSSSIAAGTTSPSCSINQVLKGQTNSHPGCTKINVGWNS
jgi:hypothetical protein